MVSKNVKIRVEVEDVISYSVAQNGKTGDVFVSDVQYGPEADKFGTVGDLIIPETGQSVKYSNVPGKEPRAGGTIPPGPITGSGPPMARRPGD